MVATAKINVIPLEEIELVHLIGAGCHGEVPSPLSSAMDRLISFLYLCVRERKGLRLLASGVCDCTLEIMTGC